MIWSIFGNLGDPARAQRLIAERHYEEYKRRHSAIRAIERQRLRAKILAEHKGLQVVDEPTKLLEPPK